MQKTRLNIILILFSISISTMLLHNIIPHHHHNHLISEHKESNCTEHKDGSEKNHIHDEPESKHKAPFHCHAFNDSDWFKQEIDISDLLKPIGFSVIDCLIKVEDDVEPNFSSEIVEVYKDKHFYYKNFLRPPPINS